MQLYINIHIGHYTHTYIYIHIYILCVYIYPHIVVSRQLPSMRSLCTGSRLIWSRRKAPVIFKMRAVCLANKVPEIAKDQNMKPMMMRFCYSSKHRSVCATLRLQERP